MKSEGNQIYLDGDKHCGCRLWNRSLRYNNAISRTFILYTDEVVQFRQKGEPSFLSAELYMYNTPGSRGSSWPSLFYSINHNFIVVHVKGFQKNPGEKFG